MPKWTWHGLMWPMWEVKDRVPSPSSFLVCFEWCVGVLKAETLIGYCILLGKAINMKIGEVIH